MTHYWGAKAIAERLGYRSTTYLSKAIRKYKIPVYLRRSKECPSVDCFYTNDYLLGLWELDKAKDAVERMISSSEAKKAQKQAVKRYAFSKTE